MMGELETDLNAAVLAVKKKCADVQRQIRREDERNDHSHSSRGYLNVRRYIYALSTSKPKEQYGHRSRSLTRVFMEQKYYRSKSVPTPDHVDRNEFYEQDFLPSGEERLEFTETVDAPLSELVAEDQAHVQRIQPKLPNSHPDWEHELVITEEDGESGLLEDRTLTLRAGDHPYGSNHLNEVADDLSEKVAKFFGVRDAIRKRELSMSVVPVYEESQTHYTSYGLERKRSLSSIAREAQRKAELPPKLDVIEVGTQQHQQHHDGAEEHGTKREEEHVYARSTIADSLPNLSAVGSHYGSYQSKYGVTGGNYGSTAWTHRLPTYGSYATLDSSFRFRYTSDGKLIREGEDNYSSLPRYVSTHRGHSGADVDIRRYETETVVGSSWENHEASQPKEHVYDTVSETTTRAVDKEHIYDEPLVHTTSLPTNVYTSSSSKRDVVLEEKEFGADWKHIDYVPQSTYQRQYDFVHTRPPPVEMPEGYHDYYNPSALVSIDQPSYYHGNLSRPLHYKYGTDILERYSDYMTSRQSHVRREETTFTEETVEDHGHVRVETHEHAYEEHTPIPLDVLHRQLEHEHSLFVLDEPIYEETPPPVPVVPIPAVPVYNPYEISSAPAEEWAALARAVELVHSIYEIEQAMLVHEEPVYEEIPPPVPVAPLPVYNAYEMPSAPAEDWELLARAVELAHSIYEMQFVDLEVPTEQAPQLEHHSHQHEHIYEEVHGHDDTLYHAEPITIVSPPTFYYDPNTIFVGQAALNEAVSPNFGASEINSKLDKSVSSRVKEYEHSVHTSERHHSHHRQDLEAELAALRLNHQHHHDGIGYGVEVVTDEHRQHEIGAGIGISIGGNVKSVESDQFYENREHSSTSAFTKVLSDVSHVEHTNHQNEHLESHNDHYCDRHKHEQRHIDGEHHLHHYHQHFHYDAYDDVVAAAEGGIETHRFSKHERHCPRCRRLTAMRLSTDGDENTTGKATLVDVQMQTTQVALTTSAVSSATHESRKKEWHHMEVQTEIAPPPPPAPAPIVRQDPPKPKRTWIPPAKIEIPHDEKKDHPLGPVIFHELMYQHGILRQMFQEEKVVTQTRPVSRPVSRANSRPSTPGLQPKTIDFPRLDDDVSHRNVEVEGAAEYVSERIHAYQERERRASQASALDAQRRAARSAVVIGGHVSRQQQHEDRLAREDVFVARPVVLGQGVEVGTSVGGVVSHHDEHQHHDYHEDQDLTTFDRNKYEELSLATADDENDDELDYEIAYANRAIRQMSKSNQWSEDVQTPLSPQKRANLDAHIPPHSPFVKPTPTPSPRSTSSVSPKPRGDIVFKSGSASSGYQSATTTTTAGLRREKPPPLALRSHSQHTKSSTHIYQADDNDYENLRTTINKAKSVQQVDHVGHATDVDRIQVGHVKELSKLFAKVDEVPLSTAQIIYRPMPILPAVGHGVAVVEHTHTGKAGRRAHNHQAQHLHKNHDLQPVVPRTLRRIPLDEVALHEADIHHHNHENHHEVGGNISVSKQHDEAKSLHYAASSTATSNHGGNVFSVKLTTSNESSHASHSGNRHEHSEAVKVRRVFKPIQQGNSLGPVISPVPPTREHEYAIPSDAMNDESYRLTVDDLLA